MKIVANGIEMNYELTGEGQTLTLIHGLGLSSMKTWVHQVPAFAQHYRVLTHDVRGYGDSAQPEGEYSIQLFVDDLYALLTALGIPKTYLAGFSMGGMIAQRFTLDHPNMVEALVLATTNSGPSPEVAAAYLARAEKTLRLGMAGVVDEQMERTFTPHSRQNRPDLMAFYRAEYLKNLPRTYAAGFHALAKHNATPELDKIKCPTLVVAGGADTSISAGSSPLSAASVMHQAIPSAQLVVIENASHYAHLEQPAAFNAVVLEFLARVPR